MVFNSPQMDAWNRVFAERSLHLCHSNWMGDEREISATAAISSPRPNQSFRPSRIARLSRQQQSHHTFLEGTKLHGRICALRNQISARADCLLGVCFQLGTVTGFFHRSYELIRICFALLDFHDGFVGMRHLGANDSGNTFECRPHSFWTIDRSGHSRNGKVHSFLCLHFGALRFLAGGFGSGSRDVSCGQHQH